MFALRTLDSLTDFMDLIHNRFFIKDRNGVFLYANTAFTADFNLDKKDIRGRTDFDLFPEEIALKYRADDLVLMESGEGMDIVEDYSQDNEVITIRTLKHPLRNDHGLVIGVIGMFWEITGEIRNRNALQENQSQLRMALSSTKIGIWKWDFEKNKYYSDEQNNKLFGLDSNYEGEKEIIINLVHPEDRQAVDDALMITDMSQSEINIEYRIQKYDGTIRCIHTRGEVLPDSENQPEKIVGTNEDVTEKRMTDETLRSILYMNRRAPSSTLDEIIHQGIMESIRITDSHIGLRILVDLTSNTFAVSKCLDSAGDDLNIPEIDRSYAIPDTGFWSDFITQKRPKVINDVSMSEGIHSGLPGGLSLKRMLAVPILLDDKIIAVLVIGNKTGPYEKLDLDLLSLLVDNLWSFVRRKQADEELERAHKLALEANTVKDRFFSIVAHDLSNPIANIRMLADHIETSVNGENLDRDTLTEMSGILKKSIETTQVLLKNLTDWSLSQRGALEFRPEIISAGTAAETAIESCRPIAVGKDIKIKGQWKTGMTVYADPDMLQTVLRNLITNAVKFSNAGEEISLNISSCTEGTEFAVQDSGVGMNEEKVRTLFSLGKTISTRGTNAEKGSGLGLVLCKEFADRHKGRISARSVEGEGSEFIVTLPFENK